MESPLPTYARYGEHGQTMAVDWMHCESIDERSRLHNWEIRPHHHESLFQLFWIANGRCQLSLDGFSSPALGPCIFVVPPRSIHGFSFEPDVQGLVITVLGRHLNKLLSAEPLLEQRLLRAHTQCLDATQAEQITRSAAVLREEFGSTANWRSLGIDCALLQLLVSCGRCLPAQEHADRSQQHGGRALEHVQRFRALIEQRFRNQPALSNCAEQIGITSTQLNRVCQQVLGCSSQALLHARLLLEAQRELAYTSMSIKQIAHGLGFADAAYFTRFYQRQTGLAPTEWRSRSMQRAA